jgi:hypothetical protein
MSAYTGKVTKDWTIHDFIEEMIYIAEMIEIPGMEARMSQIKQVIIERFDPDQRESAGLLF